MNHTALYSLFLIWQVQVIRALCRECGLDSSGSRTDLLLRISNEMKSRESYDKVFEKIWSASGKLTLTVVF